MPTVIGVSRDLAQTLREHQDRWHWAADYSTILWARDRETAGAIAGEAIGALPKDRHRLHADIGEARKAVESAALAQGAVLTEHDAVIERVREVTAHVHAEIERANQAGDLAWFNSLYREWRLKAKGLGMGMPYEQALASLRLAVYRRAVAGNAVSIDATLAAEVFPKLKSKQSA